MLTFSKRYITDCIRFVYFSKYAPQQRNMAHFCSLQSASTYWSSPDLSSTISSPERYFIFICSFQSKDRKTKNRTNKLNLGLLKTEYTSSAKTGSSTMRDISLALFRTEAACACIGYVFSLVLHTIFYPYLFCLVKIFSDIFTEEEEENEDR